MNIDELIVIFLLCEKYVKLLILVNLGVFEYIVWQVHC